MKICVFGAGAMGTSLGALLARAGEDPLLVTRDFSHVEALNSGGARIVCGTETNSVAVRAALPERIDEKFDLVFLATRQRENAAVAAYLSGILAADGALVSVQNGLPERALGNVLGEDRVYGCTLSWGAEKVGNGRIVVTSGSGYRFALGALGRGERLNEIAALLAKCGTVTVGDLNEIRYAKLAVNASFSTLSAISGLTFGQIAKKHCGLALAVMREVFALARAEGCRRLPLNGHDLFRVFSGWKGGLLLPVAMRNYKNTRSGMLKAIERGQRCDVDHVAGAALARGAELGIGLPLLSRAVALVHEIENGLAELSPESLRLLR